MQFGRNYVYANKQYISTLTGRKFDGTPEGLARLEADNQLVGKAKAGRDALPEKSRSVNFRIAQEKADKDPTGPNPFEAALIVARANISRSNFTDKVRQDEIPDLEAASRQFEERRAKLSELPRPAPEVIDPMRQVADSLRARPDKLGDKLSQTVARRLDDAANMRDEAIEAQQREQARIEDPTYQRAVKYLELEIHRFTRSVVPGEWIESAKAQLEQVKSGQLTALEWWHAYQPARVNEQAEYFETLSTAKKREIEIAETELKALQSGDTTPPADPPASPPVEP